MNGQSINQWQEANQRVLSAALAVIRADLVRYISANRNQHRPEKIDTAGLKRDIEASKAAMSMPSALEKLCRVFGLSAFERGIILLCAGVELDSQFAALLSEAQGNTQQIYPTFSLALAVLPEPHWSAITPIAPLRRWRLIEVGNGQALTTSPLRINEKVLHYLAGVPFLDELLSCMIEPVPPISDILPSLEKLAGHLAGVWDRAGKTARIPAVELCGHDAAAKRDVAAFACRRAGYSLYSIAAEVLPALPSELDAFMRLWEREAALNHGILMLECDDLDSADHARRTVIDNLSRDIKSPLIISCRERRSGASLRKIIFELDKPSTSEQRTYWLEQLTTAAPNLNGQVDALVSQFNLGAPTIRAICEKALATLQQDSAPEQPVNPNFLQSSNSSTSRISTLLWDLCRRHARPRIEELAQRLESTATWNDLVLPEPQLQILREVAVHVRQRAQVYETWGFAQKGPRGLGISVLFAGASGTGKTMAAEVLANDLRLDCYRIDLSQVVSKYIGETEKNLRRVFDAAEEGGAILLFDEADALFGKRSEVKDSHDRYANIEISYLLQRMEQYRGLAILTTNMKQALDSAFLRRIRFIVQFPFPDANQRIEIWRRIFPNKMPTESLALDKLAQLNVTGGSIRNIAISAAFLAADARESVGMTHLLRAARSEYSKIEKSLTDTEVKGW